MSNTFQVSLDNLTPRQRQLQLQFLNCRQHNGECTCYLAGSTPPPEQCKKTKKFSRSWVKERQQAVKENPPILQDCSINLSN